MRRRTGGHGGARHSRTVERPGQSPRAPLPALLPGTRSRRAFHCSVREAADSFSLAMDNTNNGKEALFSPGCEPVVEDEERRRLLWLMAEYFRTIGCTDIKARLPGFMPPPILSGTIEDHRPDFTCRQSDSARTPIILEIVTPGMVEDPTDGEPLEPPVQRRQALQRGAALRGPQVGFQGSGRPGAQTAAGSHGADGQPRLDGLSPVRALLFRAFAPGARPTAGAGADCRTSRLRYSDFEDYASVESPINPGV